MTGTPGGYKGRKAVAEVLLLDDDMRELIATRAPVGRLRELAQRTGMQPLAQVVRACVASGRSLEEMIRVAG